MPKVSCAYIVYSNPIPGRVFSMLIPYDGNTSEISKHFPENHHYAKGLGNGQHMF